MPQWQPMFGKTHSRRCFMGLNASWGSHLSSRSKRAEMRRAAAAKVDAAWRRLAMITHTAGRKKTTNTLGLGWTAPQARGLA